MKKVHIAAKAALALALFWLWQSPGALARNQLESAEIRQISLLEEAYGPNDCRRLIGAAERRHRIPAQLLSAIALTESGRWMTEKKAIIAWPWTVYAQGKGQFLASQAEAEAAVSDLKAQGVRNIDVGCMQVNLQHHGDAFERLDQALDPAGNIDYAARLLRRLYLKHRSWLQAVAHYHSATTSLNVSYRKKVMQTWYKERRWAIHERRRLVQAAYDRRRVRRTIGN